LEHRGYFAEIASFHAGGFVVVWASSEGDGDGYGIFGQRFAGDGAKVGSEFQVNTSFKDEQGQPAVASLDDGRFVVAWQSCPGGGDLDDEGQDGDSCGIYVQMFAADGAKSGAEFQANSVTAGQQYVPGLAVLADGRFVVTWDGPGGVYGQLFHGDGTKDGAEFTASDGATGASLAGVAAMAGGGFIVVWRAYSSGDWDKYGLEVFAQLFGVDGSKVGQSFQVNSHTEKHQNLPSVAELQDGTLVVVWNSDGQDGANNGVFGQRLTADGAKIGPEFQVNTHTASSQQEARVAGLEGGGFVIVWASHLQDGDVWGIFGQLYTSDGVKVGEEFQVNEYKWWNQERPAVAALAGGDFAVVWKSHFQPSPTNTTFVQVFNADGTKKYE